MELAICFLGDSNFYGMDNLYIIYHSFPYSYISTRKKMKRVNNYITEDLNPQLKNNQKGGIQIIKKIHIQDIDGYIYDCAIYYTYLLRIIQKRWRKKLELRKRVYNSPLFINYLKIRELSNIRSKSIRDNGLVGLFYGNLVVNI